MINSGKPVRLKQIAILKGNIYHPRNYSPGELPDALLNENWVTQDDGTIPGAVTIDRSTSVEKIDISVSTDTVTPSGYPTTVAIVSPLQADVSTTLKVNINTALAEELSGLPLIGPATAVHIISAREKELFKDLKDLSDRVSLPRGKWDELTDKLVF